MLGQFKSNWSPGLSLAHRRSINCVTVGSDVFDFDGYGPKADIGASAILNDFAECMFAVWALKGAFIVSRFVRLDPREPHASSAFRASRQVENKASRIEDIFRLRHRC